MRIHIIVDMDDDPTDPLAGTLAKVEKTLQQQFGRYGYQHNGTHGAREVGDTDNILNPHTGNAIGAWRVTE